MKKKLILVSAPPACGKTYVSERIANSVDHIVYLDKDDLSDLVRASFTVSEQDVDMDGEFYINNIRSAEYSTILNIAFSALRFEDTVLLNAPLGKEVRDTEFMKTVRNRAHKQGAELVLLWISVPVSVCFERMKQRNSDRDTEKLKNWESYIRKINFAPPYELEKENAVDRFMVFDATDKTTTDLSLEKTLQMILSE